MVGVPTGGAEVVELWALWSAVFGGRDPARSLSEPGDHAGGPTSYRFRGGQPGFSPVSQTWRAISRSLMLRSCDAFLSSLKAAFSGSP